jgi:hypothetical protein
MTTAPTPSGELVETSAARVNPLVAPGKRYHDTSRNRRARSRIAHRSSLDGAGGALGPHWVSPRCFTSRPERPTRAAGPTEALP